MEEEMSAEKQHYFRKKMASARTTVAGMSLVAVAVFAYEWARVRDLGFDGLRVIVYVPMAIALSAAVIFVPLLNRARYKRIVRSYSFNKAENTYTVSLLADLNSQIVISQPPVDGTFTFYAKEYKAKVFVLQEQELYFIL